MAMIKVEVVYALPDKQDIISVEVAEGSTIAAVIQAANIQILYPSIDLTQQKIGVFSQAKQLSDQVKAGDRVEIYRPLMIDPKEARRAKAKK